MGWIKELKMYKSKKGFFETLKRLYVRYIKISTFILFRRELDDGYSGIMPDQGFRCVEGNIDVLNRERNGKSELPREFFVDQTHGGKSVYFVYYVNELAYIHWVFRKGEYSRFFDIKDDTTVELNYSITLPKFLGNRVQAKAMNYICEDLRRRGYKRVVGAINSRNIPSLKSINRTGLNEFKRVKTYFSFVRKTEV